MAIVSTSIYRAKISVDVRRHDSARFGSNPVLYLRAEAVDDRSTGSDLSLDLEEARRLRADLEKSIAEAEEIARQIAAEQRKPSNSEAA